MLVVLLKKVAGKNVTNVFAKLPDVFDTGVFGADVFSYIPQETYSIACLFEISAI